MPITPFILVDTDSIELSHMPDYNWLVFKPVEILDNQTLKLKNTSNDQLLNELLQKLAKLDVSKPSTSKNINTVENTSKIEIEKLWNIFKEQQYVQINEINTSQPRCKTRNQPFQISSMKKEANLLNQSMV